MKHPYDLSLDFATLIPSLFDISGNIIQSTYTWPQNELQALTNDLKVLENDYKISYEKTISTMNVEAQ